MSSEKYMGAMNRLAKWRGLFTGWQLGTRPKGDPESDAVRDHREATLIQRCEITALTGLLIKKGIITAEQYQAACIDEAGQLCEDMEKRFPGVRATDHGLTIDPSRVQGWMKDWRP